MTENLVELKNAGAERGGRWLVRGVDLTVKPREIVTLIGPNGSGKSTTAKLALRIAPLSEGSVNQKPDLRVGYVPQRVAIDWTLPFSVKRFMTLTGKLSNDEIDRALAQTGANHLIKNEVRTLSGGEFQRVSLARAIAKRPELLVLDEPVQGVDFVGEIAIYELIKNIRDEIGCGILLVSHDLHVVMAATDKVLCFNGHVCCQGTPTMVASTDAYKQLFGPRAGPMLAVYEHNHDHTHLDDGRVRHADGSITQHCHPEDGHHHAK